MTLSRRAATLIAAAGALALPAAASAAPSTEGVGENIEHVKNIQYPDLHDDRRKNAGTDVEFAEIGGKRYAFAGSYGDGMHIIDISDPENATRVATWDCGMSQADPQVFQRDDMPGRWFVTSTMDDGYKFHGGKCVDDLESQDIDVPDDGYGTFIADVTDPANPMTVGFVPIKYKDALEPVFAIAEGASHNNTIHPSGLYLYNSNSDLMTSVVNRPPAIEVFDISDFANPKLVDEIALKPVPGLGAESHDITFNEDGDRAYSAALSHAAIIDSEDPTDNAVIGTLVDPAINVWHQSDPVTIKDPILGKRDFLIVEDEVAGALGTGQCPNGGVHIYDITGDLERNPVKVGYWNIDEVRTTSDSRLGTCTAHVFDIHEDEKIMTIAYYNGGVRVVDLSGLVGVALGKNGVGMKQLGFYRFRDSDTWAVKAPFVDEDGFYMYGNDQRRGFDVYKYTAPESGKPNKPKKPKKSKRSKQSSDSWMTPAQQLRLARRYQVRFGAPTLGAVCLLNAPGKQQELGAAKRAAGLR